MFEDTIGFLRIQPMQRLPLPMGFKGTHINLPNVEVMRTSSVQIAASRPFTLYADGDPIAELPVTIRALPEAVRAIVPAGS